MRRGILRVGSRARSGRKRRWPEDERRSLSGRRVLVFDEQTGLGAKVIESLRRAGTQPIAVRKGDCFRALGERTYLLNPLEPEGIRQLCARVCGSESRLAGVIDCWSATPPGETNLDVAAVDTLLLPMRLVHALSGLPTVRPLPVLLLARGTARVHDDDPIDPPRALGIGPARVLPQEHPGVRVAHVDVDSDHRRGRIAGRRVRRGRNRADRGFSRRPAVCRRV